MLSGPGLQPKSYIPPHKRGTKNEGMHPFAEALKPTEKERLQNPKYHGYQWELNSGGDKLCYTEFKKYEDPSKPVTVKAYKLLTHSGLTHDSSGRFMMPDNNLYTFALRNPDAPQIETIIDMVYYYVFPDEEEGEPQESSGNNSLDGIKIKFEWVDPSITSDPDVQELIRKYTTEFESKLEETHQYMSERIAKTGNHDLENLHQKIREDENRRGYIFSGSIQPDMWFIKKHLERHLGPIEGNFTDKEIKMLNTRLQFDHIQKHGIEKDEDGGYIGFVRPENLTEKLRAYQKIRRRSAQKMKISYPEEGSKTPEEIANEEWMGSNDNPDATRSCNLDKLSPDQLLLEFIDPLNDYITKEKMEEINDMIRTGDNRLDEVLDQVKLPYNRRQFVYGYRDDIDKYRLCNRFFRSIMNYIMEFNHKDIDGYSYDRLLNKYFTMKLMSTKMMFPARFIFPNQFNFTKHSQQINLIKIITDYNFIGIIKYIHLHNNFTKNYLLIFKKNDDMIKKNYNVYTGKYNNIILINFQLFKIPIGHLDYQKNITFDELRVLSYLRANIYELKKEERPIDNRIFFIYNKKYGEMPSNIASKLDKIDSYRLNMILGARFSENLKLLDCIKQSGGSKIKLNSGKLAYKFMINTYNLQDLTFQEFIYLLYPYIYIDNNQYSGFITSSSLKYRNYYNLLSIVKNQNFIVHEILNRYKINTKDKSILEMNNYFPTSITAINNSKNTDLFLYPNIKYYSIDNPTVQKETLHKYYKKYNTKIWNKFKVVETDQKYDLLFLNLIIFKYQLVLTINERTNIPLRKKLVKFVKLNMKQGGTLIFNIAYINLEATRKIVLQLQSLFKTVELYRPEIQHVFKQSGLALICQGFNSKTSKPSPPKYTMSSLELINQDIHLNKYKFYFDLFPFYDTFMEAVQKKRLIDQKKQFQLVASYLYAKQWKLKFSIPLDNNFIKKLKSNIKSIFCKPTYRLSFKKMKEYYLKFPKSSYKGEIDWSLPHYGTLQEKLDINEKYANLHKHTSNNMITKGYKDPVCGEKFYLDTSILPQLWELFIRYPEITICRPPHLKEPNSFFVVTKGKRDEEIIIPKQYDKYFVEEVVKSMIYMTELYAERLEYEIQLLKYPRYLKRLL